MAPASDPKSEQPIPHSGGSSTKEHYEPEHRGSPWTHPYILYVILTVGVLGFMALMGWVALENDWIPKR